MPRLNTSTAVQKRIEHLLVTLLAYANDELPEFDRLRERLKVRWLDKESKRPKLIVETELRFLAELVFQRQSTRLKETIKQDLQVLRKFLQILEDNRTKTQGSAHWHFTLTLWDRSPEKNRLPLRQEWQRRKSRSGSVSSAASHLPGTPGPDYSAGKKTPLNLQPETSQPIQTASASGSFSQAANAASLWSNLPTCDYPIFVGRQWQLKQLLTWLERDNSVAHISIEGIGGAGKTSLMLETAYHCLDASRSASDPDRLKLSEYPGFEAFIFTSAKPQRFTPSGILPRFRRERTLGHIFRAIARTLNCPEILTGDFDDQLDAVQASLGQQRTLLMIDNLETVEDLQDILAFLYELPATVKTMVTSRDRTHLGAVLRLDPLPAADSLQFVQTYARLKAVPLTPDNAQKLYQGTGGIPAAMVYAIGQLANGYQVEDVPSQLTLTSGDFCRFYFKRAIEPLQGQAAYPLLMALSLFPQPALREAVAQVAASGPETADGLARLDQLSLVRQEGNRYDMLPLTRDYVQAELAACSEFERTARERWLDWHLHFLQQHSTDDWQEWSDTQALETERENLTAAVEWCIDQNLYDRFNAFWQHLRGWMHFGGYWNQRLSWMDWLIQAAQERQDLATVTTAMFEKGRTLALIDRLDQQDAAIALFETVWSLSSDRDRTLRFAVAANSVSLCLRRQQFEDAQSWLQRGQVLSIEGIAGDASIDRHSFQRERIVLRYYQAQLCFQSGHYNRAIALYTEALEQAESISWQRVSHYIRSWLAHLAIAKDNLAEAEQWIAQSLPAAQRHNDRRCIAFCQHSLALIEKARGNPDAARHYARSAQEGFAQLNMFQEAAAMDDLLTH